MGCEKGAASQGKGGIGKKSGRPKVQEPSKHESDLRGLRENGGSENRGSD